MIAQSTATIRLADAEATRRNRIISRLSTGLFIVLTLSILSTFVAQQFRFDLPLFNQLLMGVFFGGLAWLTTRRYSPWAAQLLISAALAMTSVGALNRLTNGVGPAALLMCVMLGSMVLRARSNIIVGIVSVGVVIVMGVAAHFRVLSAPPVLPIASVVVLFGSLIGFAAFLAFLNARSHEQALRQIAEQADAVAARNVELADQSAMLMRQAAELAQQRELLEVEVQKRTAELQTALDDVKRSAVALRELQSPLVPITNGVLVMPLIGAFDSGRAAAFHGELLRGIEQRGAKTVLLDVTGLPVLDTLAAQTLVQAAAAAKLLGADIVLVGITPAVAQTIVGLGVDLRTLHIERDLQSAVANVLGRAAQK